MADSANVIIKTSKTAGRGLFVTKSMSPGDAILSIARPLITALDVPRLIDTCANCFTWTTQPAIDNHGDGIPTVKACTGCRTLRYCTKTCQSQSWKREHRPECKILATLKGALPNAARALLSLLKRRENGLISDAQWEDFICLESHFDKIKALDTQEKRDFDTISRGIFQLIGPEKTDLSLELIKQYLGIMMTNALTLVTPTFDPVGMCVDPLAAKANHSCEPNTVVVFDGPHLSFRSLKKIEKDEEVFIAYVDISDPFVRRQSILKTQWHFDCQCVKCKKGPTLQEDRFEDGSTSPLKSLPLDVIEKLAWKQLEQGKKCEDATKAIEHLSQANEALQSTKIWPLIRQPSPAIQQQLFVKQLVNSRSIVNSLRIGFSIYFKIDPFLFPEPVHPVRVVHNYTLAMLVLYLSGEQEDKQIVRLQEKGMDFGVVLYGLLQEVLGNVQKSHGSDSRFARMVQRKCKEVFTDMTRGANVRLNEVEGQVEQQWALLRLLFLDASSST